MTPYHSLSSDLQQFMSLKIILSQDPWKSHPIIASAQSPESSLLKSILAPCQGFSVTYDFPG